MVQDMPIECIEVDKECGVDISSDPKGPPLSPKGGAWFGVGIIWHWNCGKTVADRAKLCIDRRCEVIAGLSIRFPYAQFLISWYARSGFTCVHSNSLVSKFALCSPVRRFLFWVHNGSICRILAPNWKSEAAQKRRENEGKRFWGKTCAIKTEMFETFLENSF